MKRPFLCYLSHAWVEVYGGWYCTRCKAHKKRALSPIKQELDGNAKVLLELDTELLLWQAEIESRKTISAYQLKAVIEMVGELPELARIYNNPTDEKGYFYIDEGEFEFIRCKLMEE